MIRRATPGDLDALIGQFRGAVLQQIELADIFGRVFALLRTYRLALPPDLALLLSRIGAAGLGPAAWVDMTREEIGIPVVRAVVAGLEGTPGPAGGGYAPGARARARTRAHA